MALEFTRLVSTLLVDPESERSSNKEIDKFLKYVFAAILRFRFWRKQSCPLRYTCYSILGYYYALLLVSAFIYSHFKVDPNLTQYVGLMITRITSTNFISILCKPESPLSPAQLSKLVQWSFSKPSSLSLNPFIYIFCIFFDQSLYASIGPIRTKSKNALDRFILN